MNPSQRFYLNTINSLDLPKADFEKLLQAEENHFWFKYRNQIIGQTSANLLQGEAKPRVLELGCGNGNVLRELEKRLPHATLVGSELHEEGLANARGRVNCELRQADIYRLPDWQPFDLIGLFDVLEHLPDDVSALCQIRKALKPGAKILLTVPASMKLWSYFDEAAGHFRRYTRRNLRTALELAGFQVHRCDYFMMPLFPAMWLSRNLTHLKQWLGMTGSKKPRELANEELKVSAFMNFTMESALSMERFFMKLGLRLPFGTSLLAVGENPVLAALPMALAG